MNVDTDEIMRLMDVEDRRSTHRDGIWWTRAPLPPRLHRCKPWTCEYDARLHLYWFHCACGATSRQGWAGFVTKRMWLHKNSRRASAPNASPRSDDAWPSTHAISAPTADTRRR